MKTKLIPAVLLVGFSVSVAASLAAQETPQPTQVAVRTKQPAKPPAKNVHKVWTNDDLAPLPAPASKNPAAKETAASAQPSATGNAPAAPAAPAPPSIKLPETIQQTKQVIDEESRDTNDIRESLRQLKDELYASPESSQAQKQIQIERFNNIIDANEADLKVLQDHLQKLLAKQPAGNPTTPK